MIEAVLPLLLALIVGMVALLTGKRVAKKKKEAVSTPPENTAISAARKAVQQTFGEEVERQQGALASEDPAGALADLGNARKR